MTLHSVGVLPEIYTSDTCARCWHAPLVYVFLILFVAQVP